MGRGKKWQENEKKIVYDNYLLMTDKEISVLINRTPYSIETFRRKHCLSRPYNGRFKKGIKPHNLKNGGLVSIRFDGKKSYLYIRSRNGWRLFHRFLYEHEVGKIPEGMMLRFKDGNTLNCKLDNLMLITRREHAIMNRDVEKATKSLKRALSIKRAFKDYGVQHSRYK